MGGCRGESALKDTRRLCVGVYINSTAEKLAIYSDFRYLSRIFPTLFSKLISIFIRLHTFSMGAKTRGRLTQDRTVCLRYAQLLSLSSSVRGKLIYAIEKIMGVTDSKGQRENVMFKIWPRPFLLSYFIPQCSRICPMTPIMLYLLMLTVL